MAFSSSKATALRCGYRPARSALWACPWGPPFVRPGILCCEALTTRVATPMAARARIACRSPPLRDGARRAVHDRDIHVLLPRAAAPLTCMTQPCHPRGLLVTEGA